MEDRCATPSPATASAVLAFALKTDPTAYHVYNTLAVDSAYANPDRVVTMDIRQNVNGTRSFT